MNAAETDQLRRQILELAAAEHKPVAIARQLGCALSTVYKVLSRPGPDGRHKRRPSAAVIPESTVAELRRLWSADPQRGPTELHAVLLERAREGLCPTPVPDATTVGRLLRTFAAEPAPAPAEELAPPRPSVLSDYLRYATARRANVPFRPETVLLEGLIREALTELEDPDADPRARPRKREHVAQLVLTFMRVCRIVDADHPHEPLRDADDPVLAQRRRSDEAFQADVAEILSTAPGYRNTHIARLRGSDSRD